MRALLVRAIVFPAGSALIFVVFAAFEVHSDRNQIFSALFGWLLGAVLCAFSPFLMGNRFANPHVLRANYSDYCLAGIGGREMLEGLAAPHLAGSYLFTRVYLVTSLILFSLLWVDPPPGEIIPFFVFSVISSIVNLRAGGRFALALWARNAGSAVRALMIFAFVFSSPVTLFTILFPLIPLVFDNTSDLYYLYALEVVTLIPRLYFARRTWIGAIARLDGNES